MQIRAADRKDEEMLSRLDRHIRPEELEVSISLGRVLVAEENGQLAGWLRWNLFWVTNFCILTHLFVKISFFFFFVKK